LPLPHCELEVHARPFGAEHVPAPFALHTRPPEHEATEQHTPFVQWPLAQSVSSAQTLPGAPVVEQSPLLQV
jgi:hypothetical protein